MYYYVPDLIVNIILWGLVSSIYVLGFLSGIAYHKKKHKTIHITLQNGSVKEAEEINKIVNETFEKAMKEIKR